MKKAIVTSTIYLIIVSIIAKALSFLVRILLARSLSADAMSLYSLASPTMVFVITLAQMGIPSALSKVIAQKNNAANVMKTSIIISIINNLIVTALFLLILPFLSNRILKQDGMEAVLFTIVPLIPMVTCSGLLKGYLFGKQCHLSATACQIIEESTRILFLLFVFTNHTSLDVVDMAKIAMFSVTVGEIGSSLFMLVAVKKKTRRKLEFGRLFTNLHRNTFDEVLSVSIPMTGSRLIGSLTYFLEPIIMVIGWNACLSTEMVSAYGHLNGYVLPILTMPSFITITLSNFLLPSFTYHYTRNHHKTAAKLFTVIISTCLLIGIGCSFLCFQYSETLMELFYHTTSGADLLRMLAWPFAFYVLQPPLSSMLHALSYSKRTVFDTCFGSVVRLLCVWFLTPMVHAYSLPIGLTVGMIITTFFHACNVWWAMHTHENH
ncbi:MAG: oligosaccharide flippase family protein [Erysipelotrichaceae bacterium]|nr:oligosaccharide flippase family protein [Erysipelotrichaceae bacterium]